MLVVSLINFPVGSYAQTTTKAKVQEEVNVEEKLVEISRIEKRLTSEFIQGMTDLKVSDKEAGILTRNGNHLYDLCEALGGAIDRGDASTSASETLKDCKRKVDDLGDLVGELAKREEELQKAADEAKAAELDETGDSDKAEGDDGGEIETEESLLEGDTGGDEVAKGDSVKEEDLICTDCANKGDDDYGDGGGEKEGWFSKHWPSLLVGALGIGASIWGVNSQKQDYRRYTDTCTQLGVPCQPSQGYGGILGTTLGTTAFALAAMNGGGAAMGAGAFGLLGGGLQGGFGGGAGFGAGAGFGGGGYGGFGGGGFGYPGIGFGAGIGGGFRGGLGGGFGYPGFGGGFGGYPGIGFGAGIGFRGGFGGGLGYPGFGGGFGYPGGGFNAGIGGGFRGGLGGGLGYPGFGGGFGYPGGGFNAGIGGGFRGGFGYPGGGGFYGPGGGYPGIGFGAGIGGGFRGGFGGGLGGGFGYPGGGGFRGGFGGGLGYPGGGGFYGPGGGYPYGHGGGGGGGWRHGFPGPGNTYGPYYGRNFNPRGAGGFRGYNPGFSNYRQNGGYERDRWERERRAQEERFRSTESALRNSLYSSQQAYEDAERNYYESQQRLDEHYSTGGFSSYSYQDTSNYEYGNSNDRRR